MRPVSRNSLRSLIRPRIYWSLEFLSRYSGWRTRSLSLSPRPHRCRSGSTTPRARWRTCSMKQPGSSPFPDRNIPVSRFDLDRVLAAGDLARSGDVLVGLAPEIVLPFLSLSSIFTGNSLSIRHLLWCFFVYSISRSNLIESPTGTVSSISPPWTKARRRAPPSPGRRPS